MFGRARRLCVCLGSPRGNQPSAKGQEHGDGESAFPELHNPSSIHQTAQCGEENDKGGNPANSCRSCAIWLSATGRSNTVPTESSAAFGIGLERLAIRKQSTYFRTRPRKMPVSRALLQTNSYPLMLYIRRCAAATRRMSSRRVLTVRVGRDNARRIWEGIGHEVEPGLESSFRASSRPGCASAMTSKTSPRNQAIGPHPRRFIGCIRTVTTFPIDLNSTSTSRVRS
jgi:hypothetical protein